MATVRMSITGFTFVGSAVTVTIVSVLENQINVGTEKYTLTEAEVEACLNAPLPPVQVLNQSHVIYQFRYALNSVLTASGKLRESVAEEEYQIDVSNVGTSAVGIKITRIFSIAGKKIYEDVRSSISDTMGTADIIRLPGENLIQHVKRVVD